MPSDSNASGPSVSKEDLIKEVLELRNRMRHLEAESGGKAGKVPRPQSYNGEGSVRSFLTQSKAYLQDNRGAISGDSAKVKCIGGLLIGKAAEWWEPTLRDYLNNEVSGREPNTVRLFNDYEAFEQLLENTFGNPDEKRTAMRQLSNLKQTGSASYYYREFNNIAAKLDWADPPLIESFYKGLREEVKDELSKNDRTASLSEFVAQAIKIDNRLYERRMEKKKHGGYTPFGGRANTSRARYTSTSYGTHPGRMELDATRNEPKKKGSGVCYNCGKKGHFANKCRQKKSWKPVPERNVSVAQKDEVPHASLHFSACYQDNCLIHKSAKDGAGWYPQERRVCMTIRDWDFGTQPPPDYYESFPDPEQQEVVEETSEEGSCEEEEEDENHVHGSGIDVTNPDVLDEVLTVGAIRSLNPFVCPGDAKGVHPKSKEHDLLSWFSCVHHHCKSHVWEKLDNRWFPTRDNDTDPVEAVFRWDELYGWTIANKYPNGWALLVRPGYVYNPPTVAPNLTQPQSATPSSSQEQRTTDEGDRPKSHSRRSKETEDHHKRLRDAARKNEKNKSSKNGRRWW